MADTAEASRDSAPEQSSTSCRDAAGQDTASQDAASCRIACATIGHLGTAVWQNAVPVIREITLENASEDDWSEVVLTLVATPPIVRPLTLVIDRIGAGTLHRIAAPSLALDGAALAGLRESGLCTLTLEARVGGRAVGCLSVDLRLLPPAHWGGGQAAPELLAAFVRPNDPAVDGLLHAAASHLARAGRSTALDGYRGSAKARTWEVAQAIHAALADLGLTYVLPPASFERFGQRVRSPGEIVARRVATCLDLTLLMAACFEQAGLNPLLVLTRGHACTGLWLADERLAQAVADDAQALRKRRDLDDLILIETTLLTHAPPGRFAAALAAGARHVDEDAAEPLDLVLDLRRARLAGIRPLDLGDGSRPEVAVVEPLPTAQTFAPAPAFLDDRPARETRPEPPPRDRLETWKRRLLDLSLRNRLLNFKPGKATVTLRVPEPDALAAFLAEGGSIRLLARPEAAEGAIPDPTDAGRGEILTTSGAEDLDTRLTDLFRTSRSGLEEGGANVLHLAFGFLAWTRGGAMAPVRAPLLLVPVTLTRTSVRAGFRLVRHDDEARLNPTLVEMLRQDFALAMPDFDTGLPGDGLDVEAVWRIVRGHVRDLKGFEVVPEVVLSTFSFTKILMWKDLAERTDLLKRNRLVRHLLDTPNLAYADTDGFPAPERLDADHPPHGVFTPLSADSSQLAAVLAASAGKDFVLFGPPGTGKSQTIANMIAQCLALGRTVLFVSQKTAALDVVRRRLDAVGLGACCLEVHAAKAQKTHVLGQLREAWAARGAEAVPWDGATTDLARHRDALNGLVAGLHDPRENGLTAHAALGRVIADRGMDSILDLSWPDHGAHTPEILTRLRAHAARLAGLLPLVGAVADHPLRGIGAVEWSPLWRAGMERAIADLSRSLPPFVAAARAFAEGLGLAGAVETWDGMRAVVALGGALFRPEARTGLEFAGPDGARLRQAVEARGLHEAERARLEARLFGVYGASVHEADLSGLLAEWRAAKGANFLLRGARLKRIRRMLEPDARGPLPDDLGPDLATLVELARLRASGPACPGILERALAELGPPWSEPTTPADGFTAPMAWAVRIAPVLAELGPVGDGPDALRARLGALIAARDGRLEPGGVLRLARDALRHARLPAIRAIAALNRLAGRDEPEKPLATGPGWPDETLAIAARWASALPKAQAWTGWRIATRDATLAGLGPLVAAIEAGHVSTEAIAPTFEAAYARWWIDHVVTHDSRLRGFFGQDHEGEIARFRAADARVCALAGAAVRARIGAVPGANAFGADPEWGTLAREIAKRARHLPLRTLFSRMPNALTRLTPCVMMSPLSIAQHWPADARAFDVVIFDEASQIAPWDAIGAIARGNQTVIVGDPEQLPPTQVGERVGEDQDLADVTDQESILDECLAAGLPQRRLSWHYRSRHESLIAFSNRHYYRGGLVTFPSPVTQDRAVRLIPVADGLYERGGARVNRPEARAVVADLVARLRDAGDDASLGIVTFNGEQQRLIENLLDAERRADPGLERHFDPRTTAEPVFVKNLETVQGDERDVILFSVAVGPDGAGRITGQISSLNREGGHRRLNVAITRARRGLFVFASLRPDQIDLGRGAARGIRDFKHFLEFAERGARALETAAAPTGRDVESPFEACVMAALESRGWRVVPQVGVSAFRIDLGIVHPDAPGRYLAGVECDGATYHSAATARDRDRLRHAVLSDLGWRLHRVWSTDWWIDADGTLERLDAALRAELATERVSAEAPSPEAERAAPPPPYRMTDLTGLGPDPTRFHDPGYDATLHAMVAAVIATEGPVFSDGLVARLMRAHGFTRTTARLRERVLAAVGAAVARSVEDGRVVLWPDGTEPSRPVAFRPAEGETRDVADIPLAELAGLAAALDPSGDADDLPERMAAHLGVTRLRETMRARLTGAVGLAKSC